MAVDPEGCPITVNDNKNIEKYELSKRTPRNRPLFAFNACTP